MSLAGCLAMNLDPSQISIRPANPHDVNFIYSTWINSYQFGSTLGRSMRKSLFQPAYRKVIDYILAGQNTMVWVAESAVHPDTILAYLVCSSFNSLPVIHYAFTKEPFRKLGLQWRLYNQAFPSLLDWWVGPAITYTHQTSLMKDWCKYHQLTYNPLMLYKQGFNE
jgi:hypothetical protein